LFYTTILGFNVARYDLSGTKLTKAVVTLKCGHASMSGIKKIAHFCQ